MFLIKLLSANFSACFDSKLIIIAPLWCCDTWHYKPVWHFRVRDALITFPMSHPNNVRGPTSALTEFLRVLVIFFPLHCSRNLSFPLQESGISVATIARRARNTRNQRQGQEDPTAVSSRQNETESAEPGPSTQRSSYSQRQTTRTRLNLRVGSDPTSN